MEFKLTMSLKRRTMFDIALMLLKNEDVNSFFLIRNCEAMLQIKSGRNCEFDEYCEWKYYESVLTKKLNLYGLPPALEKEIASMLKPLFVQLTRWVIIQKEFCSWFVITKILPRISWTFFGTIDECKTARNIIDDESISILWRFRFACIYCLEDSISPLWNKLSSGDFFYRNLNVIKRKEPKLVFAWSCFIVGKLDKLSEVKPLEYDCDTSDLCSLFLAVEQGAVEPVKYFSSRLSSEELQSNIQNVFSHLIRSRGHVDNFLGFNPSVVAFLMSKADDEQQIRLFRQHHDHILRSLLEWPWQEYFLKMLFYAGYCFNETNFYFLLSDIMHKRTRCSGFDRHYIFQHTFMGAPLSLKNYIIELLPSDSDFLFYVYDCNDISSILMLLSHADLLQRRRIFVSGGGRFLCHRMLVDKRLDFLISFIECCNLPIEKLEKFRSIFAETPDESRLEILKMLKSLTEEKAMIQPKSTN